MITVAVYAGGGGGGRNGGGLVAVWGGGESLGSAGGYWIGGGLFGSKGMYGHVADTVLCICISRKPCGCGSGRGAELRIPLAIRFCKNTVGLFDSCRYAISSRS